MPRPASHPLGACLSRHDSSTKRSSALFGPQMRRPRLCDSATCQSSPFLYSLHQSPPSVLSAIYRHRVYLREDTTHQQSLRLPYQSWCHRSHHRPKSWVSSGPARSASIHFCLGALSVYLRHREVAGPYLALDFHRLRRATHSSRCLPICSTALIPLAGGF